MSDEVEIDAKQSFGLVGDGNADDTQAFDAALDAADVQDRPVVLPPGVYRITKPVRLVKRQVRASLRESRRNEEDYDSDT